MGSSGTIKALWVGPYGSRFPDGTILETGITVCDVGADEAKASDNWKPVKAGRSTSEDDA